MHNNNNNNNNNSNSKSNDSNLSNPHNNNPLTNSSVLVPTEPPKTSYEVETFWNSVRSEPLLFGKYLRLLEPAQLGKLFRSPVPADMFSSILQVVELWSESEPEFSWNFLEQLPHIYRFETNVLFKTQKDKLALNKIFSVAEEKKLASADKLAALKSKFRV
jgi:hypothetical protein